MFNLATLQQYYTPFEVFTVHFAALPWLFLVTINYFQKPERRNVLLLILTLLLATPQGYVPTLFVVWLMATTLLTLFLTIKKLQPFTFSATRFVKFYMLVLLVNAFWLLPFAYFTLTNAQVNVNAKINQMASENIYLLNKEFGNVSDVMILKGFWLQHVEPNLKGEITYSFAPWREHLENQYVLTLGYVFFGVICLGILGTIRSKSRLQYGVTAIFVLSFIMLATSTPPFAQINWLLREIIPLFREVFRFPFTKFSLLASLVYAVLFAIGLQLIILWTNKRAKSLYLPYGITAFFVLLIVIFQLPSFRGDLFYERNKVKIPKEYEELFSYLETKDPSARITTFPHHTFWDWKFYTWGYSGSGFLWYGIKQPILDRSFDMWGQQNENYYFELAQALYAKNSKQFEAVLQKYHVSYLLSDQNIEYPPSPRALFYKELDEMLATIPSITKEKTFRTLSLYKIALKDNPQTFITLTGQLPRVNPYTQTNDDLAYLQHGNYIATTAQKPVTYDYLYPFRSLFSFKTQTDKEFTLTETNEYVEISDEIPPLSEEMLLTLPPYGDSEMVIPIHFEAKRNQKNDVAVYAVIELPQVTLNDKTIYNKKVVRQIAIFPQNKSNTTINVNLHGLVDLPLALQGNKKTARSFLSLTQDNILILTDKRDNSSQAISISPESLKTLPELQKATIPLPKSKKPATISVRVPKITDEYLSFASDIEEVREIKECNIFRKGDASAVILTNNGLGQLHVQAHNATSCTALFSPNLPHNTGYALFIDAEHKKGKGFHFWVVNYNERYTPIDTYLPQNRRRFLSTFILPPQDANGKAYSFHLDSMSIGNEETSNVLNEIDVYPIPYSFLTSFVLTPPTPYSGMTHATSPLKVTHPNESLYVIDLPESQGQRLDTLILSQSYDKAWKAYAVAEDKMNNNLCHFMPFFCGAEIKDHAMINNWANGWVLPDQKPHNQRLILVYLPQYLEYLGFLLLGLVLTGSIAALILLGKKRHETSDPLRSIDE